MIGTFAAIVGRDVTLAVRRGGDAATVVAFFVVVVTLFPFGVGPEPNILARIGPGVLWVTALLAAMLSLDRLFQSDLDDGSLEQLVLTPEPLSTMVLAKCLAHWLTTGLPLTLVAPMLALLLNMDGEGMLVLIGSLLLGTPVLSLLGAVGAALALGARRVGALVALLVLPLTIPVLIFGVAAVDAALADLSPRPHLLLLGALLLAALALCPWATAAALRQAVE